MREGGGGRGPERVTEEMKPERRRESETDRWSAVEGTEVRPRRAREAFCRCEQKFERWTSDIVLRRED